MVNSLTFTQPQAYSGGVDFSQLANLGNVYREAQERQNKLAALGQLTGDPQTDMRTLIQSRDPQLAALGIGQSNKLLEQAREDARYKITDAREATRLGLAVGADRRAAAAEGRAAQDWGQDDPEFRKAQVRAQYGDAAVNDPRFANFIYQNAPIGSPYGQAQEARAVAEETRAQAKFDQTQKYATREQRLQAVKDGELDINNPEIRRWVALGGDIPDMAKNRLGLGAPTYTRDKEGNLRAYQLSATGEPVPVQFGAGETVLGPGEVAQQRAEGTATGKGIAGAKMALPDVVRNTDQLVDNIDQILSHESKSTALGRGSHLPDWAVAGTGIADFRERVAQLSGEAMQQTMASLKGSGLGSVSDYEQRNMMKAFVRAGTAQTEKAFNEAMADAKKSAEKIREIARGKARGDFSEKPKPITPGTRPSLGSIFGN